MDLDYEILDIFDNMDEDLDCAILELCDPMGEDPYASKRHTSGPK